MSQEEVEKIKRKRKRANSGRIVEILDEFYNDWDEVMPTLPLDAVFKAFAKEIIYSNPKLKAVTSPRDKAAPRKRLNVLEPLRSVNQHQLKELRPLVAGLTKILNEILIDNPHRVCRFGALSPKISDGFMLVSSR